MTEHSKKKIEDLKKVLEGHKKEGDKAPEGESPRELSVLNQKLETVENEARENKDKLLRVMADFENYKKRAARDHEDQVKYSLEKLIRELLPVLDDFARVLEHLPQESSPAIRSIVEGTELTYRHFLSALKKLGLQEVETGGQVFNPHLHEAMAQVETDELPEGHIVDCHRKGYLLQDRLLRPALVTVAKGKNNNEAD